MSENSIGPGTVLAGRFRLEDLLQETEGARYWRATDQILARSVAVHVVAASDPRAGDLLAAARASATITDGHFLRVLDAAQEDGVAYVVNEWGTGSSLDTILSDAPLPPRRAAWLVKEVAEAIGTAHRGGVAHGRLRPESVMVSEAGAVKVIGFAVDAALNGRHAEGSSGPGEVEVGLHSDVAGLAALLYATLVGRWPGAVESTMPAAPRVNGRALRPRQVRAGVPRPLDGICERALNPEAQHHAGSITTAREICAALDDFIGSPAGFASAGEATTVIDRDLPGEDPSGPDPAAGPPAQTGPPGPGGPPWATKAAPVEQADPEATRAGAPVFFDDDTSVGWTSADERAPSRPPTETPARPPAGPPAGPPTETPAGPPARPPVGPAPEPEQRPLFAPDPVAPDPVAPDPVTPRQGRDRPGFRPELGTGSLPAAWGPDEDRAERRDQAEGRESKRAGMRWLTLAAVIAAGVVLFLIAVFAFNLGRGPLEQQQATAPTGPGPTSQSAAPAGPVPIAAVSDFDPQGDPPEENSEDTGLAVDGDPSTAWATSTYYDPLELQKDGVGLLVDLGKPVEVSEARLRLAGSPTDLQLFAAGEDATAPANTEGLDMVASITDAGTTVALPLDDPVTTQYLVVWLTSLPTVDGGFKAQIAEIVVRS